MVSLRTLDFNQKISPAFNSIDDMIQTGDTFHALHVKPRYTTFFNGGAIEALALIQDIGKLAFQSVSFTLSLATKPLASHFKFEKLAKFNEKLSTLSDVWNTSKHVATLALALFCTLTLGVILPATNLRIQRALDVVHYPLWVAPKVQPSPVKKDEFTTPKKESAPKVDPAFTTPPPKSKSSIKKSDPFCGMSKEEYEALLFV